MREFPGEKSEKIGTEIPTSRKSGETWGANSIHRTYSIQGTHRIYRTIWGSQRKWGTWVCIRGCVTHAEAAWGDGGDGVSGEGGGIGIPGGEAVGREFAI
jgi:hypothetical protein